MHPRVAYWVSSFEPDMEAVASEVRQLRDAFPGSVAWGLCARRWALLSYRRGFSLHPRFQLLFRAATRLAEPAFQLNHIFGSLGDWFYLEGRRRRPTILTVAVATQPVDRRILDRVDRFVVEDHTSERILIGLGIERERIRTIHTPVDIERFHPAPPPPAPFTVLFASSPDRFDWLAGRGVHLLLDTATFLPEMRFRLLWRPWGDSLPHLLNAIRERGLSNVQVVVGKQKHMARQYRDAHVTVAPFVRAECCKPSPNSVVESLASGRPVVVTSTVGIGSMIEECGAGFVCERTPESLGQCLDRLRRDWPTASAQSRILAKRKFDGNRFVEDYSRLYAELLDGHSSQGAI